MIAQPHGRLDLVDVLTAGARRAERVPLDVRGVDDHLDRIVHSGRHEDRREGRLALVERRQTHHAVHAVFAFEIAVGVVALDFERAGLDAYLVARLVVERLDLVAVGLAPAGVHAQQHRRPVERLGAAGSGVDVQNSAHLVLVATQHVAQFERFDVRDRLRIVRIHLLLGDHPLFQEIGHQFQILDLLADRVVIGDPALDRRHPAQLLLRTRRIVPEVGVLRLLLLVLQIHALAFDVETLLQRIPTARRLLDLFCQYHKISGLKSIEDKDTNK